MKRTITRSKKKFFIIGNVSSGKSTFLNATLKYDILPTSSLVTTAKKIIVHIDNKIENPYLYWNNKKIEISKNRNIVGLLNDNKENDDQSLLVKSSSLYLNNSILIDTPGLNNALDYKHELITKKALEEFKDYKIILLLSAENLFSFDDKVILQYLCSQKIGTEKKITVVINKIDAILLEEEDTIQGIKKKCSKFLRKNNITNFDVFITSAIYFKFLRDKKSLSLINKRKFNLLQEVITKKTYRILNKDLNKIFK